MAASSSLLKLRSADLTTLLSSIGSRSTGTKVVMVEQLLRDSKVPKLGFSSSHAGSASSFSAGSTSLPIAGRSKAATRVLSIDMGIKNLAFCVCDVPALDSRVPMKRSKKSVPESESILELSVVAWKRIAVTGSTTPIGKKKKKKKSKAEEEEAVVAKTKEAPHIENEDPFSPMSLSKTAYKLVREILLPYAPDTILIERQRFRSGGGSAVQEWTVRVNMFESMIWAVLTTLKNEGPSKDKGKPQVWDVSPMRVASFWIGDAARKLKKQKDGGVMKKKGRTKVEKKEKVDLVQRWILSDAGGIEVNEAVDISFRDEAARTRDAFLASKIGVNRKPAALRKVKEPKVKRGAKSVVLPVIELPGTGDGSAEETLQEEPLLDIGKLDDLADCLLQAGAWTKWEMNRKVILAMIEDDDVERVEEWIRAKDLGAGE